ncbi:unnamed protein product [Closterium sp. NIES-54]
MLDSAELRSPLRRGSRPTALRVTPCCSPHVALCCSARRALLQPARRTLLPRASRPAAARASRPASLHSARPAACAAQAEPRRPPATNAAAAARATTVAGGGAAGSAGGAAGSAGGAAGAGGTGGAAGSTGGAAGAGVARGGQQRSLPLPDDPTPQQLREWVIQRGSPGGGGFGFMWSQRPRDCASQRCIPGRVEAAALGSSESAAAPGASESAAALGARASRCFFPDCTTVTPLAAPIPVSLADPTGGPVVARASAFLLCLAVPSGSLSGLHLPAFSTNLLSNAVLQDEWVDTFIPGGQRVAICKCSRTGHHLAMFTCLPGSGLYTLTTASAQVAESGQVAASIRESASGHPSLPRLRSMHSGLLVSGLPRSLPSLPCSPAPPCLPCVEGRQRAAPHSSEFPPTTAPLQILHMDVWGPAPVGGTDQERYFLLVVDDYTCYTIVFPLRCKAVAELQERHTSTDMGELQSYLGLQITQDRARCTITLTQSHMVHQVLQHFGFTWSSPQPTPLSTGHSLLAPPSDESVEPIGPYPELVGCLMYLMTCTRPDLAYPLSLLARYVAPGKHRKATQRSSKGYTFSLGSASVSWRSTRSSSVLGSSYEAEIYAGAMAAQELRWLTYLLTDLGERPRSPPVLYVDNKAMLALCCEQTLEHRTKHIALRYFLARELQQHLSTRVVVGPVLAWAEPTSRSGVRSAANLRQ